MASASLLPRQADQAARQASVVVRLTRSIVALAIHLALEAAIAGVIISLIRRLLRP